MLGYSGKFWNVVNRFKLIQIESNQCQSVPNEHHDHAKFSVYPIATRPGPTLGWLYHYACPLFIVKSEFKGYNDQYYGTISRVVAEKEGIQWKIRNIYVFGDLGHRWAKFSETTGQIRNILKQNNEKNKGQRLGKKWQPLIKHIECTCLHDTSSSTLVRHITFNHNSPNPSQPNPGPQGDAPPCTNWMTPISELVNTTK